MASFKLKKNQNPFLTGALIRPRVPRPRYGGNRTGVPAGFQARVGKLFDKIRREAPKKIFCLPTLVFSLSIPCHM